jgi:hypothetical protein
MSTSSKRLPATPRTWSRCRSQLVTMTLASIQGVEIGGPPGYDSVEAMLATIVRGEYHIVALHGEDDRRGETMFPDITLIQYEKRLKLGERDISPLRFRRSVSRRGNLRPLPRHGGARQMKNR